MGRLFQEKTKIRQDIDVHQHSVINLNNENNFYLIRKFHTEKSVS